MIAARSYRRLKYIAVAALLAGCAAPYSGTDVSPSSGRASEPSVQSQALSEYYKDLQYQMRLRGLLMQDDGSFSVTARLLARNFEAIALYDEYTQVPAGYVRQSTPSQLRRWEKPVRMAVEFGDSVSPEIRQADTAFIHNYAQHLSTVADHPISISANRPNYLVLIMGEDDRQQTINRVRAFVPNIADSTLATLDSVPRSMLCMVYAFPNSDGSMSYGKAVAVIRAEHPTLLRQSCIHEEVAQGLGLANDSPQARPSIFNDDEEFGFLTRHDELLLKILYDDRLSVGMSADQARPIVQTIANELAG